MQQIDDLIRKYLASELTSREQVELQSWLAENPEHSRLLSRLEAYQQVSAEETEEMREVIWDQLQHRITEEDRSRILEPVVKRSSRGWIWKIAAALLVICLASVWVLKTRHDQSKETIAPLAIVTKSTSPGQKITTILPDGTVVKLNSLSSISFPEKFSGKERRVELSGEAFFDVTHDASRPFYVSFRNSEVKVLGTSFNIRTYREETSVTVAVASGRVSFTSTDAQSKVILEPNELVSYDEAENKMVKRTFDPLDIYGWKDHILYFKNDEFEEIVGELEKWYGVKITYTRDFHSKGTFSGEFENKSLGNVLIGLSYLYEFTYEIDGDKVILK